jgi:hypothetical protein
MSGRYGSHPVGSIWCGKSEKTILLLLFDEVFPEDGLERWNITAQINPESTESDSED